MLLQRLAKQLHKLQEARAIQIHKASIENLTREIVVGIARKKARLRGPQGDSVLFADVPYSALRADGSEMRLHVQVRTTGTQSPYYVVSGGFGKRTRDGMPTVVVLMNGGIPFENILRDIGDGMGRSVTYSQLYPVLLHEFTHAADLDTPKYKGSPEDIMANPKAYYNDLTELHAYVQEIVEELQHAFKNAPMLQKALGVGWLERVARSMSKTWEEIEPHLTEKNKRWALKAIATALRDYQKKTQ